MWRNRRNISGMQATYTVLGGRVCSWDHCSLGCAGVVALPALPSQPSLPLFVHQTHCASDACLVANNFSTLWERILFVFLKFD